MLLDEKSKTNVSFAYSFDYAEVIARTDTTNLTSSDKVHLANGTLQPGQTVEILHRITECLLDILPWIIFKFNRSTSANTSLFLAIDVISEGDQGCGSQIGTFQPNLPVILIIVGMIIVILLWIISKIWID